MLMTLYSSKHETINHNVDINSCNIKTLLYNILYNITVMYYVTIMYYNTDNITLQYYNTAL